MSEFKELPDGPEPRLRIHVPVRPLAIPAELLAASPDASVRYEHGTSCGISGSFVAKVADLIEEIGATMARHGQGRFHPDEAAHLLAEAQGIDSRALLKRMGDAFRTGHLVVREFDGDLPKGASESWGKTGDIVFVTDIDSWLASQGVPYRFPKLEDRSSAVPTVGVQTTETVHPPLVQMRFDRLLPKSADFRGGRIADVDLLQLGEAALMASRHSGADVTVKDILRTAARGEIPLKALVHRRAKVFRRGGGGCINVGHPSDENVVPVGAITTLPLVACEQLANAGQASWRTFDGFKVIEPERWLFVDYGLTADEPDFETAIEDCRITGYDLHAVADAFLDDEAGNKATHLHADQLRADETIHRSTEEDRWKVEARKRALAYIKRQSERGLYPSQQDVADVIAKQFKDENITGSSGKPLRGESIKRHALKGIESGVAKLRGVGPGQGK